MFGMNIFNNDAFSAISLTNAIESVPFLPSMLGDMGIFADVPVRTTMVAIEERSGVLGIIPTDVRGAPPKERKEPGRVIRAFPTMRIAQADTLMASELQNVRPFGQETQLQAVGGEIMRRATGPTGIAKNIDLTHENMRLGAVQGQVADADGSVLIDWFSAFGITQDAEIDFAIDAADTYVEGALARKCTQVARQMAAGSGNVFIEGVTQIHALVGDNFWDDFIAQKDVRETYKGYAAGALQMRNGFPIPREQGFYAFGIYWHNYRGVDTSTVTVGTDKAKFFPVNAPGVFQVAWAPGESFEFVNTLGRPRYMYTIPDRERDMWVRVEMYSYPLFMCTRPKMLQRARRT
jgi:hypothetical protein